MYTGPNTVNDGLVFGYDTGYGVADNDTATRFYSGEPITNYLSSGVSNYNVVQGAAWSGATPTFTLGTSEFGTPIGTYTVGSTNYMYSYDQVLDDDFAAIGGQVVTFSIYLKRTGASANVGMRVYDNVSGYSTVYAAATEEFQRFTMTKTLGANPTRIFIMIDNTNGGVIDFHSPQLEIGSTASPFVDGTRSSTKSLIDLKRLKDIDISNVSFDSTGQPTFDGTDDTITFNPGTFPTSWQQPFSVEAVVYIPSGATWYNQGSGTAIIGRGSYTGSWGLFRGGTNNSVYFYMRTGSNTFNPGGIIGRDKFYHIVGTWDGTSQAIFYINGSQNSQETSTSVGATVDNTGDIKVGGNVAFGGNNGGYGEGTFPVVKLYSKKLTATEIQQNYKAYKNRFNI